MKIKILIVIAVLAMVQFACTITLPDYIEVPDINLARGSGNVISQTFKVNNFHQVSLDGAGELNVTFGEKESLTIEAEDDVMEMIKVEVKGGELTLGFKEHYRIVPTKTIKFYLTAKTLDSLTVNGAGDVSIEDISGDNLDVTINGAAEVTVSGKVDEQHVTFNGAGKYEGDDLESEDARVEINGFGDATVWATGTLNAVIDGAGSLNYYGRPQVTQYINGAGSVESKGEH